MKKLLLGLCLVFGANILNAEEYSCTYNFKQLQDSVKKGGKALNLGLLPESRRYFNDAEYYIKQVLINCEQDSEKWKVSKEAFDNLTKLKQEGKL